MQQNPPPPLTTNKQKDSMASLKPQHQVLQKYTNISQILNLNKVNSYNCLTCFLSVLNPPYSGLGVKQQLSIYLSFRTHTRALEASS